MFPRFKHLLLWIILISLSLIQLLLYLPNLTCNPEINLPICTPQFSVSLSGSSTVSREFLGSIREFLRLLSYLTIDMGWSNELISPDVYDRRNLIDTFDSGNTYDINYFGFCKTTAATDGDNNIFCSSSARSGMDIPSILVKDIGVKLGTLSTAYVNSTESLGNSLLLTYHLAIASLRNLIRNDLRTGDDTVLSLLIGSALKSGDDNGSKDDGTMDTESSKYVKGIELAYMLMRFNSIMLQFLIYEMVTGMLSTVLTALFGVLLLVNLKIRLFILILRITAVVFFTISTVSFLATVLYLAGLKSLEPSTDMPGTETPDSQTWGLLEVTVGTGFIVTCVRYMIQCVVLVLTFLSTLKLRSRSKKRDRRRNKSDTGKNEQIVIANEDTDSV